MELAIIDDRRPQQTRRIARQLQSVTAVNKVGAATLTLFLLPPYSPELNPDEFVWNDLKNHGTGRKLITSLTQLRQKARYAEA